MVASAKEEKSDKIVIENIGPIERLEFAPKPGTITVFRGRNGAGKSTALNAINGIALNGSQRLTSRDGTVGGKVEGFGATLKIARKLQQDPQTLGWRAEDSNLSGRAYET